MRLNMNKVYELGKHIYYCWISSDGDDSNTYIGTVLDYSNGVYLIGDKYGQGEYVKEKFVFNDIKDCMNYVKKIMNERREKLGKSKIWNDVK